MELRVIQQLSFTEKKIWQKNIHSQDYVYSNIIGSFSLHSTWPKNDAPASVKNHDLFFLIYFLFLDDPKWC